MDLKQLMKKLIPNRLLQKYKEQVFYKQLRNFDVEKEPDLKTLLQLSPQNTIALDIGANVGLYTKFLADHCSKVISIEPVPFTFQILLKMVKRFDLKHVETRQLAVSNHEGIAEMEVPVIGGTQNYYRAQITVTDKSESSFFKVQTITLDNLVKDFIPEIGIIKVDVEGHELEVLEGAENILNEKKAIWLVEIAPANRSKVFEIMEGKDYKAMFLNNGELFPGSGKSESVNWFFIPE